MEDFNGKTLITKNKGYTYSKIEFTVLRNDLKIVFPVPRGMKQQGWKPIIIEIANFSQYTALDIINKYPNGGTHFEDGIFKIWKYYDLDFGFIKNRIKLK